MLSATCLEAQSRKTWDFREGMSDATKLDLNTDTELWTANRTTDDGEVYGWKNVAKLSSTFMANGKPIEEFTGLSFGGTLTGNSVLIDATSFRLARKDNTITLPKLVNGQTVTLIARSANSTATDRGFVSGNANMTYVSGPDGGICLGKNAEGASEDGNYTLVWQVTTEETDSVECIIKLVTGGLDIGLIMIDNGDEPEIETDANVGFLYTGDIDSEPVYAATGLADHATLNPIPYEQYISGEVTKDSLMKFDVVVVSSSVYPLINNWDTEGFGDLMNFVPILNFEPVSALGYTSVDPKTYGYNVSEDLLEEDLFKDVAFEETETGFVLPMFDPSLAGQSLVYGLNIPEGNDFASDEVFATVDGNTAIHVHGKKNSYMLIPFATSQILEYGLADAGNTLLQNALNYLKDSKGDVLTASKPTATITYENGVTTVALKSAIAGAKIYYTVDGSEPTAESNVYTDALVFTAPATIKAIVKAPAYYDSPVFEQEVIIKTTLSTPSINVEGAKGSSTITLSTNDSDAQIYYSFNGQSLPERATVYVEPIVITEPGTVTAFAYAEGYLASELAVENVRVGGIPAVRDTLAHFNANSVDWFENVLIDGISVNDSTPSNWKNSSAYYFGKSAWSCYSDEVDHTEIVYDEDGVTPLKDINGNDSVKVVYVEDPNSLRTATSSSNIAWIIKSNGQVFTGETTLSPAGYAYTEGASANRYYDTALDCIGGNASQGALTFGGKVSGEPFTGRLESTITFATPFDVIVYAGNGSNDQPNVEIQVSMDGEIWDNIGTVQAAQTIRHIKKTRVHYDDMGEYYVRLAQTGGSSKLQVYDLMVVATEGKTGIETIENDSVINNENKMFDLFGRQILNPTSGQIYIQNGKKIIIR